MSEVERLVDSIVAFLRSERAAAGLGPDAAEGLVVAAQCLENSYGRPEPAEPPPDLLEIFSRRGVAGAGVPPPMAAFVTAAGPFAFAGARPAATAEAGAEATPASQPDQPPAVTPEAKAQAEALKNEGNALMKAEKFNEALAKYTEAIAIDSGNAIFFCNRAAAHSSLKNNDAAIEDCRKALALNPKYGRAYGRLGLALTNLDRHAEAREAYRIACKLEPQNEAYRNNLAVTEETLRRHPPHFPGVELGSLIQNQTLANVATQMLSDPALQNLMSRMLGDLGGIPSGGDGGAPAGGAPGGGGGGGLDALLQAGQQLAQQMQQANPELVEQLRQQMTNPRQAQQPPPPSKPPQ